MPPGTVAEALHQGALPLLPAVSESDPALPHALATMKTATGMLSHFGFKQFIIDSVDRRADPHHFVMLLLL